MFRKAVPAGVEGPRANPADNLWSRLGRAGDRALDALVLRGHGLAVRFDRVPQEFGEEAPVDEADPKALRREWLRQLELWAGYNPEEVFAWKAGAAVFGAVLVVLVIFVAAM